MERGYRWDSVGDQLDWWDLHALFTTLPYDAPINRARDPKHWWWGHPINEFIVGIFESTQMTAAVVEKQPKLRRSDLPKPIPRPWDTKTDEKKLGTTVLQLDDMKAAIGW